MWSKSQREQLNLLADPRFMAGVTEQVKAAHGAISPEVFADTYAHGFGLSRAEMVRIGREINGAWRRKSDGAKGRALGRAALRIFMRHLDLEIPISDPRYDNCALAQFLRVLFDVAADLRAIDQNPKTAPPSVARVAGYLSAAAKMLLNAVLLPDRSAIVAMAHAVLVDDGRSFSKLDVDEIFEALLRGRSLREWLATI